MPSPVQRRRAAQKGTTMKKRVFICLILAAAMALTLGACGQKKEEQKVEAVVDGVTVEGEDSLAVAGESIDIGGLALRPEGQVGQIHEYDGMKLVVPLEYDALVTVETGKGELLFSVSETESIQAAEAKGYNGDGAGFLFGIDRVSRDELNAMRCQDMSGMDVIAADDGDICYICVHPTDVRVERMGDLNEADLTTWTELNEWAAGAARESFIAENGLTALTYGNSEPETALARAAYDSEAVYTVSTLEFGPLEPAGVDAAPFVERLTANCRMEYCDEEAPDGEYAVLRFPEEDVRYDFFFAEGFENYIRKVSADGEEWLFKAVYADGTTKASAVMEEWYQAIAQANGKA